MTEKLYYLDAYATKFTAKVLECTEDKKNWKVVLDRTLFYPEGGGQPADMGTLGGVKVLDAYGNAVHHEPFHVDWDLNSAEKGGYAHYMLKEIHEQPEALQKTCAPRRSCGDDRWLPITPEEASPSILLYPDSSSAARAASASAPKWRRYA